MSADLAKSGLNFKDVTARLVDETVREICKLSSNDKGYVIPYYDIKGRITQFYRVKLLDTKEGGVKYIQPPGTSNYVYFPPNWAKAFAQVDGKLCVLTEGEKKAALATRMGIPCVAFGGVDSWRNRTVVIPKTAEIKEGRGNTHTLIRLPSANFEERLSSTFAIGFDELTDLALQHNTTFVIIYDRDTPTGTSAGPQRAAARLGYELRFKGFSMGQIRQLVPPSKFVGKDGRATIEDILLSSEGGPKVLGTMITENLKERTTFPRHPNVREFVAKQLSKALDRRMAQATSLAVLTELDAEGSRMYSPDDFQLFYFDAKTKHLMKVNINSAQTGNTQESEFGKMLYQQFSVSMMADHKFIEWLGTQYAAEDPVENVTPYRVLARPTTFEDTVRFQVNNGQYIKVTGEPKGAFTLLPNGGENILFETVDIPKENVIDGIKLVEAITQQLTRPLINQWALVLKEVRLKYPGKQSDLISLLYYISPWLLRWRGMQLPVEILTGEAGSGKSTLYEVRLNILTGDPRLSNAPNDHKDWYASLANSGGMNIIDNIGRANKDLRERMSDELCRLITEHDPRIRMRKYFTEADERSIRVSLVHGFTAIQPPFQNSDLIQRAIWLELAKNAEPTNKSEAVNVDGIPAEVTFDSHWKDAQIERFGGRTGWVAHHMIVLHKFFALVKKKWNPQYKAKHRLVNLEQSLMLMAEVLDQPGAGNWIPEYLTASTNEAITQGDWAMEGLIEFAELKRTEEVRINETRKYVDRPHVLTFQSADISAWAESHERYEKCYSLINPRAMGRYLQANKYNILTIAGIQEFSRKNNTTQYRAIPLAKKKTRSGPTPPPSSAPKDPNIVDLS